MCTHTHMHTAHVQREGGKSNRCKELKEELIQKKIVINIPREKNTLQHQEQGLRRARRREQRRARRRAAGAHSEVSEVELGKDAHGR